MCGITGYVGSGKCRSFILEGLARLEYRGYDSAGFVCLDTDYKHLRYLKATGKLSQLVEKLQHYDIDGTVGIGHTRWATHGIANEENAHPHFDCQKSIGIVHNGIIENYHVLRKQLIEQGHVFHSMTDSEVIAHLFESILSFNQSLHGALVELVAQLHGAYALTMIMEEYADQLIVVRRKSPLAIGIGDGEKYIASDPLVFSDKTNKVLYLPENSFAIIKKDTIALYDFSGKSIPPALQTIDMHFTSMGKGEFSHFMLKEIYEQKQAIERTINFFATHAQTQEEPEGVVLDRDDIWEQIGLTLDEIRGVEHITMIAAGTSWHAARIAQFFFEMVCKIPVQVFLASEFRYMPFFTKKNSVVLVISQSGETADTLEALRMVNESAIPTIVLTNVASSTMVQEANGFMLMQAGPEISVGSTKAFSCQLASLYWFAHWIALQRGQITRDQLQQAHDDLIVAAEILELSIELYKRDITHGLAQYYAQFDRCIFLGRHVSYPFAMEAALKLKEIAYVFAQSYPAGELKHGPLALIDAKTPIILFSSLDELIYQKLLANAQEVKARSGHLLVFAFEGQDELINLADNVFVIPRVKPLLAPLAMSGLMQFWVYQIALVLNLPIDKPRNLAKSVTVE